MKIISANASIIETRLRLLGASKIERVSGVLYFVKFILDDGAEVAYAYNLNAKDQYFLHRIKPYPLPEGLFSNEDQVVEFISRDITKFKNAHNSTNFSTFVELGRVMNQVSRDVERLFLNYNVDKLDLVQLIDAFHGVQSMLVDAKDHSAHVVVASPTDTPSEE